MKPRPLANLGSTRSSVSFFQYADIPQWLLSTSIAEERIPYLEGYTTPYTKNTDFIHEFVVSIYDIVGYD
jgi:hypothetical protein